MPFGNKSLDNEHIGYLTSAQALADYAELIDHLQGNTIKPRYPVIAFGGELLHFMASSVNSVYKLPISMFSIVIFKINYRNIQIFFMNQSNVHPLVDRGNPMKSVRHLDLSDK